MLDAAAGALRGGGVAGGADAGSARRLVGAQAGAQVAASRAAVDVAAAGGATEAEAGAGGGLAANEVHATSAFVVVRRRCAQLAGWQAKSVVVRSFCGSAVVQHDALGGGVDGLAGAAITPAVGQTQSRTGTFTRKAGRTSGETGEAGAAVAVVLTDRT